jgi:hypothetical protein
MSYFQASNKRTRKRNVQHEKTTMERFPAGLTNVGVMSLHFKVLSSSFAASGFSFDTFGHEYDGSLPPLLDGNLLVPMRNEADLRSQPADRVRNYLAYLADCITKMQTKVALVEHILETDANEGLPHINVSGKRKRRN